MEALMEKLRVNYSKETASLCTNIIEPRYSPACVAAKLRMSQLPSLDLSLARLKPRPGTLPEIETANPLCTHRMMELARRIEESAASSSVWMRLGGEELSGLRNRFRNLLERILNELDSGE